MSLPKIFLSASDYPRLKQLARLASQRGELGGIFLMAEINRAVVVPRDAESIQWTATIGSWITYSADFEGLRKTVQLVWPEHRRSHRFQISILSPLGAALIGLHVGDKMPYLDDGRLQIVRIERVTRPEWKIIPLPSVPVFAGHHPIDDDPGPTAA
ncbi:GreA/GreB family elongation factor [Bradyrhizobium sp. SYSU BS000235]|uniref:GreA/GreB family elongation factor n=1 Tax=Bradyrhizobium sp. SYSU BS000235 TaxID=3411332 RepID=UPI003C75DBA8